jgi:hypothetical protein
VGNFVVCFVFGALRFAYGQVQPDETAFKDTLLRLIEAGEDNFESIKGEIDVEHDGFTANVKIPGSQWCVVSPTESGFGTYSCLWLVSSNTSLIKPETQRLVQLIQRSLPPDWNVTLGDSSGRYPGKRVLFNREKYGPYVNIEYVISRNAGVITFNMLASAKNFSAKKKAEEDSIVNTPKTTKKTI